MNPIITEPEYRKQIGKTAGKAYLFFGEEDYLKSKALEQTEKAICPDSACAVFNDMSIDAIDFTPEALYDAMIPLPMMAEEKLVTVRGLAVGSMKPSEVEELIEVLKELADYEYNTVILIVPAGMLDAGYLPKSPSALLKKLAQVTIPVHFETPSGAKLNAWVARHFQHRGVQAAPAECVALTQAVGNSMLILANEVDKIAFFVKASGRSIVSAADIAAVASPAIECDTFALSNAILDGKYQEAMRVLGVMKFERVEPVVILGNLAKTFCDLRCARVLLDAGKSTKEIAGVLKLNEYPAKLIVRSAGRAEVARLSRAIALCGEADLSIKLSFGDYSPIEKLICSL